MTEEVRYRKHMALSVDVDRFSDAYLVEQYAGVLKADDGHVVQVPAELRMLCFSYRNRGFECFPPCDHTDETGHCLGHEIVALVETNR